MKFNLVSFDVRWKIIRYFDDDMMENSFSIKDLMGLRNRTEQ